MKDLEQFGAPPLLIGHMRGDSKKYDSMLPNEKLVMRYRWEILYYLPELMSAADTVIGNCKNEWLGETAWHTPARGNVVPDVDYEHAHAGAMTMIVRCVYELWRGSDFSRRLSDHLWCTYYLPDSYPNCELIHADMSAADIMLAEYNKFQLETEMPRRSQEPYPGYLVSVWCVLGGYNRSLAYRWTLLNTEFLLMHDPDLPNQQLELRKRAYDAIVRVEEMDINTLVGLATGYDADDIDSTFEGFTRLYCILWWYRNGRENHFRRGDPELERCIGLAHECIFERAMADQESLESREPVRQQRNNNDFERQRNYLLDIAGQFRASYRRSMQQRRMLARPPWTGVGAAAAPLAGQSAESFVLGPARPASPPDPPNVEYDLLAPGQNAPAVEEEDGQPEYEGVDHDAEVGSPERVFADPVGSDHVPSENERVRLTTFEDGEFERYGDVEAEPTTLDQRFKLFKKLLEASWDDAPSERSIQLMDAMLGLTDGIAKAVGLVTGLGLPDIHKHLSRRYHVPSDVVTVPTSWNIFQRFLNNQANGCEPRRRWDSVFPRRAYNSTEVSRYLPVFKGYFEPVKFADFFLLKYYTRYPTGGGGLTGPGYEAYFGEKEEQAQKLADMVHAQTGMQMIIMASKGRDDIKFKGKESWLVATPGAQGFFARMSQYTDNQVLNLFNAQAHIAAAEEYALKHLANLGLTPASIGRESAARALTQAVRGKSAAGAVTAAGQVRSEWSGEVPEVVHAEPFEVPDGAWSFPTYDGRAGRSRLRSVVIKVPRAWEKRPMKPRFVGLPSKHIKSADIRPYFLNVFPNLTLQRVSVSTNVTPCGPALEWLIKERKTLHGGEWDALLFFAESRRGNIETVRSQQARAVIVAHVLLRDFYVTDAPTLSDDELVMLQGLPKTIPDGPDVPKTTTEAFKSSPNDLFPVMISKPVPELPSIPQGWWGTRRALWNTGIVTGIPHDFVLAHIATNNTAESPLPEFLDTNHVEALDDDASMDEVDELVAAVEEDGQGEKQVRPKRKRGGGSRGAGGGDLEDTDIEGDDGIRLVSGPSGQGSAKPPTPPQPKKARVTKAHPSSRSAPKATSRKKGGPSTPKKKAATSGSKAVTSAPRPTDEIGRKRAAAENKRQKILEWELKVKGMSGAARKSMLGKIEHKKQGREQDLNDLRELLKKKKSSRKRRRVEEEEEEEEEEGEEEEGEEFIFPSDSDDDDDGSAASNAGADAGADVVEGADEGRIEPAARDDDEIADKQNNDQATVLAAASAAAAPAASAAAAPAAPAAPAAAFKTAGRKAKVFLPVPSVPGYNSPPATRRIGGLTITPLRRPNSQSSSSGSSAGPVIPRSQRTPPPPGTFVRPSKPVTFAFEYPRHGVSGKFAVELVVPVAACTQEILSMLRSIEVCYKKEWAVPTAAKAVLQKMLELWPAGSGPSADAMDWLMCLGIIE
ncbi:hypothetical protein EXIGLDRAFT_782964 [Exidia glandulosa HHB12029]|uniref:Uncharacterized protein n=1 Tax=Exidia glandulosa HHB12029 TaxID=1314781 RepID=A0A165Z3A4_EXIGL|nr:hypothetical protein EXIGLDRAFT_782964 [Exidia glandulosa HHB12029]